MASERQRQANSRNGRKGGPKTAQGKQRSRVNSIKHGLTSTTLVVLPEENPHEYEEVLRGFRESLRPDGSVEDALVLRLAQAHWRSLRARRVETSMLHTTANTHRNLARAYVEDCPEHLDVHGAIGVGFLVMPPDRWHTYLRYDTAISREFFKTLDALTKLQRLRPVQTRQPNAVEPAAPPPEPAHTRVRTAGNAAAALSDSGIRSVSQNDSAAEPEHRQTAGPTPVAAPRLVVGSVPPVCRPQSGSERQAQSELDDPRVAVNRALTEPSGCCFRN